MTASTRSQRALWPAVFTLAVVSAGCSAPTVRDADQAAPSPPPTASMPGSTKAELRTANAMANKGGVELERGIKSYEEGAYKNAARQLQSALDLGLRAKADQAKAHKYLAFMTCVSGREKSCREEFRKALDADPTFDLGPAEIGHPIWGAIFRSVKADAVSNSRAK